MPYLIRFTGRRPGEEEEKRLCWLKAKDVSEAVEVTSHFPKDIFLGYELSIVFISPFY